MAPFKRLLAVIFAFVSVVYIFSGLGWLLSLFTGGYPLGTTTFNIMVSILFAAMGYAAANKLWR